MRSENKYLLSATDAAFLKNNVSKILKLDSNCKNGEYTVRSLYFDSLNDIDYHAKLDGTGIRKKIRLRIYDYTDNLVKLEVKYKFHNKQCKQSLSVSKTDAENIIKGNYEILLSYGNDFTLEVLNLLKSGVYRPTTLIEYKRLAFLYSEFDTRITFDSDIYYSESDFRLFEKTPIYNKNLSNDVILEVKFNTRLPSFISDILKVGKLNQLSMSKYCIGRPSLEKWFID